MKKNDFEQLSLFDLTQWKNDKKEEPKNNDKADKKEDKKDEQNRR